jgi:hypothetical protein
MLDILSEATVGSLMSLKQIALVVIPLMTAIEILKDLKVLDKIASLFLPIVKVYGMKKESGLPIVVGLLIGLAYGAGVIMRSAQEDNLSKRDLYLITYFLVSAHSVFEDTLVFVAIGASGTLLLTTRIFVAALFTFLASRLIERDFIQ